MLVEHSPRRGGDKAQIRSMNAVRAGVVLVAALAIGAAPSPAAVAGHADDRGEEEVGLRALGGDGVNANDLFARWPAPLLQAAVAGRFLPEAAIVRWEVSLGYWRADNDDATVLAAGPTIAYPLPRGHWNVLFGVHPTLFSDYRSENRNLGGRFEFTSHVGIRWKPYARWYIGARIQHTSNAGIYRTNPGVDLFAIELGIRR